MSVDGAISTIVTHATNAGTAMTRPLTDVSRGDPVPNGRSVRVWYAGETDAAHFDDRYVLSGELIGHAVVVTAYFPIPGSDSAQATARDQDVVEWVANLRTNIDGDCNLGGNATDLELDYAQPDFAVSGGTWYRVIESRVVFGYSEYTRTA